MANKPDNFNLANLAAIVVSLVTLFFIAVLLYVYVIHNPVIMRQAGQGIESRTAPVTNKINEIILSAQKAFDKFERGFQSCLPGGKELANQ